jgi:hypothetical protein
LSMDAVQQARSGHPGTPMALAPVIYTLWQSFLRFDPEDPIWPNRDRFVLSVGHASMLLYSMLHLTGVRAVNAKYERLGELDPSERRVVKDPDFLMLRNAREDGSVGSEPLSRSLIWRLLQPARWLAGRLGAVQRLEGTGQRLVQDCAVSSDSDVLVSGEISHRHSPAWSQY